MNVIRPPRRTTNHFTNQRQVQARRRLTMSSSRRRASSVPKRLGHGITLRTSEVDEAAEDTTTMKVTKSDLPTLQPSWWWNQ